MSDKIEDGGPAFPTLPLTGALGSKIQEPSSGLSMRDYLIAHAPINPAQGDYIDNLRMDQPGFPLWNKGALEKIAIQQARWAVAFADAMLLARKGAQP